MDIFYAEESPYFPGKYVIKIHHEKFHCISTTGSYNVMPARLLNLTYASYCRYCRDQLGCEVCGINKLYPVVYFPSKAKCNIMCGLLNTIAELVEFERENPNFREHQQQVIEHLTGEKNDLYF